MNNLGTHDWELVKIGNCWVRHKCANCDAAGISTPNGTVQTDGPEVCPPRDGNLP